MENNKTINSKERQAYESVDVKVIKVTSQGVLCSSFQVGNPFGGTQKNL